MKDVYKRDPLFKFTKYWHRNKHNTVEHDGSDHDYLQETKHPHDVKPDKKKAFSVNKITVYMVQIVLLIITYFIYSEGHEIFAAIMIVSLLAIDLLTMISMVLNRRIHDDDKDIK